MATITDRHATTLQDPHYPYPERHVGAVDLRHACNAGINKLRVLGFDAEAACLQQAVNVAVAQEEIRLEAMAISLWKTFREETFQPEHTSDEGDEQCKQ
jgi:hypothetical protein